jgi:uncharacterized protein YkwD
MRFIDHVIHLLIPRQSNNHRAKIIQADSLLIIASLLIAFNFVLNYIPKVRPGVLGYAASISKDEIVNLTNAKRVETGLSPLIFNETLSSAAFSKARDMIDRDYWAHTGPDGTTPWSFFSRFGYKYRYAGENLARDFSSAGAVVDAWMNSPTHRDNILNPKYKEIGVGITEGDLAGVDSTIVVQFFGTTYADKVTESVAQVPGTQVTAKINPRPSLKPSPSPSFSPVPVEVGIAPEVQAVVSSPVSGNQKVLISPFTTTRTVSITVLAMLILVYMLDAYLVSKRKITRIAGRTFAHVTFLLMILMIVLIIKSGSIL